LNAWLGGATIDFSAVPHLDDFNGAGCVIDCIDDAELTLANTVAPFGSRKLFTSRGPRLRGERRDAVNDALAILLLTKRFDLLCGGWLDEQPISGHVA
jgi:hypothetical protein